MVGFVISYIYLHSGVQSGKIKPIQTEPNRNRKNGLDFQIE